MDQKSGPLACFASPAIDERKTRKGERSGFRFKGFFCAVACECRQWLLLTFALLYTIVCKRCPKNKVPPPWPKLTVQQVSLPHQDYWSFLAVVVDLVGSDKKKLCLKLALSIRPQPFC